MQFPKDVFETRVDTNMNAADFLRVYNDLTRGEVVNLNGVDAKQWVISFSGYSYEIKTNDDGIIVSLFRLEN